MFKGIIRNFKKSDIEDIENIYALYWGEDREFLEKLYKRLEDESGITYLVAEENEEILGVSGFRKAPMHMLSFTETSNPAELYILAVKHKGKGVGEVLVKETLSQAKSMGYSEMVLYSGETHKDSWGFYDYLKFKRLGPALAPNGEAGQIWQFKF